METLKDVWPEGRPKQKQIADLVWHVARSNRNPGYYWLWPDESCLPHLNVADFLHYGTPDPRELQQGYGGRAFDFTLYGGCDFCEYEEGTQGKVRICGPWKSNAEAFYSDNKVDFRHRYLTRGIIFPEAKLGTAFGPDLPVDDAIYIDREWKTGRYERVKEIAQQMANDRNITVWYSMTSMGGGMAQNVKPSKSDAGSIFDS